MGIADRFWPLYIAFVVAYFAVGAVALLAWEASGGLTEPILAVVIYLAIGLAWMWPAGLIASHIDDRLHSREVVRRFDAFVESEKMLRGQMSELDRIIADLRRRVEDGR